MYRKFPALFYCLAAIFVFNSPGVAAVSLPDLAPPNIQLVDEYGVDLLSGQVTHKLETVSIGGAMGLSHTISSFTNNFSMKGYYGYHDKYYGKGRVTVLKNNGGEFLDVIQVNDFHGTANFTVIVNGQSVRANSKITSGFTYQSQGDPRHTLERKADGFVHWTKPDGTVSKFVAGTDAYPESIGLLVQVIYPNGFTIDVDWISSKIKTNTGFALKYIYQFDESDRYMDPGKPSLSTNQIPPVNPQTWANLNPKYIQAINLARENCLWQTCTGNWPKAEFDWPAGMPRTIYLDNSVVRVIDATGGETRYFFRGYDLAYDESNRLITGRMPNFDFSPRLVGVKPAGSNNTYYHYNYRNKTKSDDSTTGSSWTSWVYTAGDLVSATLGEEKSAYSMGAPYYSTIQNSGGGHVWRVVPSTDRPGTVGYAETIEGKLNYEPTWRNVLQSYVKHSGDRETFEYDDRGNLTKATKNGASVSGEYPATCSESTRKYCNKPLWTSDAKGNKTWFTYHPPSGEVETITYPADKMGLVRKVRYEYSQKQAYYYEANGNKVYGSPIWLKTAERSCATTNTMGSTCAIASDEIVTRYEYNHDNLFMTGITVTAADASGNLITKRTCYHYDQYGNKIGETEPKANLAQCVQ